MRCFECGQDFLLDADDDPERDICSLCEVRQIHDDVPELIHPADWCNECNTPVGVGNCLGCAAVSAVAAFEDNPEEEDDA